MSLFDVIIIAIYIGSGLLLGEFLGTKYGGGFGVIGFIVGFFLAFTSFRLVGRLFHKLKTKRYNAAPPTEIGDK